MVIIIVIVSHLDIALKAKLLHHLGDGEELGGAQRLGVRVRFAARVVQSLIVGPGGICGRQAPAAETAAVGARRI